MFNRFSYSSYSGFRIILKYLYRFIAALILVPFTVLLMPLKILGGIYRFIAVPAAVVVSAVAVYFCVRNAFEPDYIKPIIGSILGVGFYFVLPAMISVLDDIRESLKDYVLTPIIVLSPVKFTL